MTPTGLFRRFCAAVLLAAIPATSAGLAGDPETERRVTFEMATQALQDGDSRLAADLFRALVDVATGPERALYSALLLRAEGRAADSDAALEELLDDVDGVPFAPDWAWSELVVRVARQRLAVRHEQASRDLEAILARHYVARGGESVLRSLQNMVVRGTLRSGGTELAFRLARKRPRFYRLDIATPEGRRIDACDGQVAWNLLISPSEVVGGLLDGATANRVLAVSYFDDVLLRYRQTGERLYFAGTETVGAGEAYRIEIDGPAGHHETSYLDAVTLLEVKRVIWGEPGSQPAEVISVEYGESDQPPLPVRQVVETADGVTEYSFEQYDLSSELDPSAFDLETVRQREMARIKRTPAMSSANDSGQPATGPCSSPYPTPFPHPGRLAKH